MSNTQAHGAYRTGLLWAAACIALGAVVVGSGIALFGMIEFDERCMQGMTPGPGRLLRTRDQAFPPATICEFEGGDVSSVGGHGVLNVLLWAGLLIMITCLLAALIAECLDPRPGGEWVAPMSRTAKLRRTGTVLFVTGSVFALLYGLSAWQLFTGPSSVCSAGADWQFHAPQTLDHSFFPPQATCRYASGEIWHLNSDAMVLVTCAAAIPALIAALAFALAWWRRRSERREQGEPDAYEPMQAA